jgi:hypothetical protein
MNYKIAIASSVAVALLIGGLLSVSNNSSEANSPFDIGGVTLQQGLADGTVRVSTYDFPVYRSIEGLLADSDVVVVGRVSGSGESRNLARDPRDPSKDHPNRKLMSQEYTFEVENYVKGDGDKGIEIIYGAKEMDLSSSFEGVFPEVALEPGERYVLFLRKGKEVGYFGVGQPWQFELKAGKAIAKAFSPDHAKRFSDLTESELFKRIGTR